jgi:predicted helicase
VKIIDPATGTGNFIVNLINRVDRRHLETFYRQCLFANEVMLLPYYVASLNIEHEYYERPDGQMSFDFLSEKNSERVERQKQAKINVIIGNPSYNVGQINENDNNKNRAYAIIDARVRDTYVTDSTASSNNKHCATDSDDHTARLRT